MRSLIDRLKASARPAAVGVCVALAGLMAGEAHASNYCQQQSRSIGQQAARSGTRQDAQQLSGMLGAAVGSFVGGMVCGPDEREVRREQQKAEAERRRDIEARERAVRERERELQQRERALREESRRPARVRHDAPERATPVGAPRAFATKPSR